MALRASLSPAGAKRQREMSSLITDIRHNQANITICFHLKDLTLAYKIRTYIGYGTITRIKNRQACKYVLTNKFGIKKMVSVLEGKLLVPSKIERCVLLRESLAHCDINCSSDTSSSAEQVSPACEDKPLGTSPGEDSQRGPVASH